MDKKLKDEKLKMWQKQADQLQQDLDGAYKRKGEAAQEGDLRENAAYQMAIEDSEMISARLAGIQKLIKELETK